MGSGAMCHSRAIASVYPQASFASRKELVVEPQQIRHLPGDEPPLTIWDRR